MPRGCQPQPPTVQLDEAETTKVQACRHSGAPSAACRRTTLRRTCSANPSSAHLTLSGLIPQSEGTSEMRRPMVTAPDPAPGGAHPRSSPRRLALSCSNWLCCLRTVAERRSTAEQQGGQQHVQPVGKEEDMHGNRQVHWCSRRGCKYRQPVDQLSTEAAPAGKLTS